MVIGGGGGGSGGGSGNGVGNVSMSREASSTASPSRGSGAQSPTLPAMVFSLCVLMFLNLFPGLLLIAAVDRDGDRYLDDDDVLSSGQVSPLSACVLSCQLHNYLIEFT